MTEVIFSLVFIEKWENIHNILNILARPWLILFNAGLPFLHRNYSTELLAFEARLGEKFDEGKLRQAFISPEYVEAEMRRQEELEINTDNPDVEIQTNTKLATEGRKLISESLRGYLRTTLPYLPEEGVQAVCNKLCQDKLLARVSFHIGTMDLILVEVSLGWKAASQQPSRPLYIWHD
jgi:hypothetical protein